VTDVRAAAPAGRRAPRPGRLILPLGVLSLGLAGFFFLPGDLLEVGCTAMWMGLVGLALYLPMAALRELPLNAAALTGLGAYLFAFVARSGGAAHWLLAIAVAVGSVTAMSALSGLGSLAVTGLSFTAASLVVQIGMEKTVLSVGALTGGAAGRAVPRPDLHGWFDTGHAVYLVAGVTCLLVSAALWYLKQTRLASMWVLAGHQPEAAAAVGLRPPVHKVVVFALSGAMVGIAGCLAVVVNGTPPAAVQFGVLWSIILVAVPLASGMRTVASVWLVAASFAVTGHGLQSRHVDPDLLAGGIVLLALLSARAQAAFTARLRRRSTTWESPPVKGYPRPALEPPGTSGLDCPSRALVGRGIAVSFGAVRAVDLVDVRVRPGQRLAIMGAGGAGKTTLIDALSGFVPLSQGTVSLGGGDLTGLPPHARARAGVSRTFQRPRLAEALTVRQNLEVGHGWSAEMRDRAEWLMRHFRVHAVADVPVDGLSFGLRRRVELVRALVCRPEVVLLDEPVGGLADDEVTRLVDVMLDLQELEGWGLLLVERNADFVKAVADHLIVLENGVVVAEGRLDEVWDDDRVRRIHLGGTMPVRI
jgi:ABC-type branched-subunit amino acid transport system ATPase component/ABC-type branched-subunit amino acid transport system permease subunit